MVTCGGQATLPMVAAISSVTPVHCAEIVASITSKSAGSGTRANIDEFTETTSHAIEAVGGAGRVEVYVVDAGCYDDAQGWWDVVSACQTEESVGGDA